MFLSVRHLLARLFDRLAEHSKQEWFEKVGIFLLENYGFFESLSLLKQFISSEIRNNIKKSILLNIDSSYINSKIALHTLKDTWLEFSLIEHLLKMYSLNQIFFSEISIEKKERYKSTFDIQWALEIKNSISNINKQ